MKKNFVSEKRRSKRMKITGNLKKHYLVAFWLSLVISLCLIIGGFFSPPQGVVHGSILESAGIIFLYPALAFGAKALEEHNKVKISHGSTTISIGQDNDIEDGVEVEEEI